MKNYDVIDSPESVTTKLYVDTRIAVQAEQPTDGAEIWFDTDEPDPLDALSLQVALLTARIEALEARL